jgi:uncharacterized membrane protein
MANNKFSVTTAVKYGLYTVVEKILFFLGLDLVLFALFVAGALLLLLGIGFLTNVPLMNILTSMALSPASQQEVADILKRKLLEQGTADNILIIMLCALGSLAFAFIYRYLVLGLVRVTLDIYDHNVSSYKRLFGPLGVALKAFIASVLYNALVTLGTLCFIIPGIIVAIRCSLYQQFLVDEDVGIIESLKESARITKGSFFKLFGIGVIFWLLNCLMIFTFGLIALITYPAFYLTQAYVYRKLLASR